MKAKLTSDTGSDSNNSLLLYNIILTVLSYVAVSRAETVLDMKPRRLNASMLASWVKRLLSGYQVNVAHASN